MLHSPAHQAARHVPVLQGSISGMSSNMKQMRSKMEEDEQLRVLMAGFRGQNLDESDFAQEDVRMNLMEMSVDEDFNDQLPLYYDPDAISAYWDGR
jgi:aarF domain-containing kinase